MFRLLFLIGSLIISGITFSQTAPLDSLAYRVTNGTSQDRINFRIVPDSEKKDVDWFRLIPEDRNKILIEGNNNLSLAVGLNHFLKYYAKIHINWINPSQSLPEIIKMPIEPVYLETDLKNRYYLNYCTFSYSMPFWDEERWMQEIDWMALHGVNLALSLTGIESVWKKLLEEYGYTFEEICEFIPGPAYMAWWQMSNLEGWGGPLPESWYENQEALQKKIVTRMNSFGINPVLPGYAGMVPRNFEEKTGIKTQNLGTWCGFNRPGFVSASDSSFKDIAKSYYDILTDLYGLSEFYSLDPFHEGGNVSGLNLIEEGKGMYEAMKRANPDSKWVIQSWQANPRKALIEPVPEGEMIILDLYSEKVPKWKQDSIYGNHDWLYCMLLNFGGNIGMHGRFNKIINDFDEAKKGVNSYSLKGIGATPEGIENNPIMYELLFELPWHKEKIDGETWLKNYLEARYGLEPDDDLVSAWNILIGTVYNAPEDYNGEGTVESLFCARPSWFPQSASTWGNSSLFYSPDSTAKALKLIEKVFDKYAPNSKNFVFDYVDISRQANADEANRLINQMSELKTNGETDSLKILSEKFLGLILKQDSLLQSIPIMNSDFWINSAGKLAGDDKKAEQLYKKNAAMLITVWGDSIAANKGGLHDYSHREWSGILRELYYPRWKTFFDYELNNGLEPDFYRMEKDWVMKKSENSD